MYHYPADRLGGPISISLIAAMFVMCTSCITEKDTYRNFDSAPLFGMVYDKDNQPCSDVRIAVDGTEQSNSDVNGRFIIDDLAKGTHTISAVKEGYEPFEVSINFLNKTQVLYLQIISIGQLLKKAEESLDRKDVLAAEKSLERARNIKPDDPVLQFLTAVYLRDIAEYEKAVELLKGMLSLGYRTPAVYLMLADIYQYNMADFESAGEYLLLLSKFRPDASIQQRIDEITYPPAG